MPGHPQGLLFPIEWSTRIPKNASLFNFPTKYITQIIDFLMINASFSAENHTNCSSFIKIRKIILSKFYFYIGHILKKHK